MKTHVKLTSPLSWENAAIEQIVADIRTWKRDVARSGWTAENCEVL